MPREQHIPKPFGCCPGPTSAWAGLFAFLGVVLLLCAILIPHFVNKQIEQGIRDQIVITSKDSPGFNQWASTLDPDSSPLDFPIYVFDLVNPADVVNGRRKPFFKERGPYWYIKNEVRTDVSFVQNGTFIKHKVWEYWTFDASRSCAGCTPQDNFTTLNIPLQAMFSSPDASQQQKEGLFAGYYWLQPFHGFFVERSVNDIIFGYDDPGFEFARAHGANISTWYPGLNPNTSSVDDPEFVARGYDMVYTGQTDESLARAYYQWHGSTQIQACPGASCPDQSPYVDAWATAQASRVPAAGLGNQFRRPLNDGDTVEAFVTQCFRAFKLRNNGTRVTVKGIELLSFRIDDTTFKNASTYPPNADFYQFGTYGFANISKAQHSMNVFLSQPHFLHADPAVLDLIGGDINPDPSLHDTVVNVEPHTGATMDATKSIQVNWFIGPIDNPGGSPAVFWSHVPRCYFPVAWLQESGQINDQAARKVRDSLLVGLYVVKLATYLGGALCVLSFIALAYLWWDSKNWTQSRLTTSIQVDDGKARLLDTPVNSASNETFEHKVAGDV